MVQYAAICTRPCGEAIRLRSLSTIRHSSSQAGGAIDGRRWCRVATDWHHLVDRRHVAERKHVIERRVAADLTAFDWNAGAGTDGACDFDGTQAAGLLGRKFG